MKRRRITVTFKKHSAKKAWTDNPSRSRRCTGPRTGGEKERNWRGEYNTLIEYEKGKKPSQHLGGLLRIEVQFLYFKYSIFFLKKKKKYKERCKYVEKERLR